MKQYNVSLSKPNIKFGIKIEDRIIRIKGYLKNIWTFRKYFIDKYGVKPPVISADQMPLLHNASASQKTLSLKSEEVFVKENYSFQEKELLASHSFVVTRKLNWNQNLSSKLNVHEHTSLLQKTYIINGLQKYLTELSRFLLIDKLPNRFNMLTEQSFAINVLDDYSVHLMPEFRQALLKKG